jgi:SAM-dependent methyltransferase
MPEMITPDHPARAVWAAGDYDAVAALIWDLGPRIVRRLTIGPGDDVLDVACGTGNVAVRAAQAGATVIGVDITPELFAAGRRHAARAGVDVEWVAGDAEALPFPNASFDAVVSVFGAMFAPDHEAAAAEMARVLRPGGRLGLCSWTPDGNIGDFFRLFARHVPPAPGPVPTRWGSEAHVRDLFDGTGLDLQFAREELVLRFDSVDAAVQLYETRFGPVVSARRQLEPAGEWPAVREELAQLFHAHNESRDGALAYPAEYLVAVGHRVAPEWERAESARRI